jgi:hypothetical protein
MNIDTLWFEIAIVCGLTAFGSIFFGHFEEHTPKFRRVLKLILFNVVVVLLSKYLGRAWSFGFLSICLLGVAYIHAIWLPGKGINGLTGEPKEKYYKMRGWERFLNKPKEENAEGNH